MIRVLMGDELCSPFRKRFNKILADKLNQTININEYIQKEKQKEIVDHFLNINTTDSKIIFDDDSMFYEHIEKPILELECLKQLKYKTMTYLYPLKYLHKYYQVKFMKKILNLHHDNFHNFIIVTNDDVIVNEIRIGVLEKKIYCEQVIIEHCWENTTTDIEITSSGSYKDILPHYFGDNMIEYQLSNIIDLQSQLQ